MLENKKEGRTGDRELSGRVDWIIVPSFLLLYLVTSTLVPFAIASQVYSPAPLKLGLEI